MPDRLGGTSPYLNVPVLDPSLVESGAVEGPCDLAAEGRVTRSPMFSAGPIGLATPALREFCIGEPLLDMRRMSEKVAL